MVWQQALYLVNLLCKFVPCDYNFPYPDTSLSEPQAFQDIISVGYDERDRDKGGGLGSLHIGGWGEPDKWHGQELDYTKNDPLVVITKTGKLRGYWMKVVGGRKIRAWEGIPFAEPPTGYFRFSEPSPKVPWSGLHHAVKKGPKCLQFSQIELQRIVGSEDCLCLNIYAPQVKTGPRGRNSSNFPVMIFIHGGGFQISAGNDYGPSYLLQQDIILVTFNYRVGIFGFLSTGDAYSPGNYGLKDQALAIQWVAENIGFFNGDPSRITLIGQEAGGASVHLQMLSGRARRYFQAGVSMSGTAFNHWVFSSREAAKDLAKHFAKKVNCPHHSSEAIVSCLRRTDAGLIAKAQIKFLDDLPIPLYLFRPVLEEVSQKEPPFITETPEVLYQNDDVSRIPWISGFTEDEGLTFLLPLVFRGTIKQLRNKWNHLAADFLDYEHLKDPDEITKKINWLYFKQQSPLTAPIKTFSDALSTRFTLTGVHKGLQAHSLKAPTYGYMFSYNGKYNLATMAGIKPHEWGVGQGEDTFYLLNSTHLYQGFRKSDHELILAKIMVNLFGNFASKRVPTFTLENNEDFEIWTPITDPRNMSHLLIHKKIKMIPEPYLKQVVYWESIGLPDTLPLINSSDHYHDFHAFGQPPQTITRDRDTPFGFSTPDVFDGPPPRLTKAIEEHEQKSHTDSLSTTTSSPPLTLYDDFTSPVATTEQPPPRTFYDDFTTTTTTEPPPILEDFAVTTAATTTTPSFLDPVANAESDYEHSPPEIPTDDDEEDLKDNSIFLPPWKPNDAPPEYFEPVLTTITPPEEVEIPPPPPSPEGGEPPDVTPASEESEDITTITPTELSTTTTTAPITEAGDENSETNEEVHEIKYDPFDESFDTHENQIEESDRVKDSNQNLDSPIPAESPTEEPEAIRLEPEDFNNFNDNSNIPNNFNFGTNMTTTNPPPAEPDFGDFRKWPKNVMFVTATKEPEFERPSMSSRPFNDLMSFNTKFSNGRNGNRIQISDGESYNIMKKRSVPT